MKNETFYQCFNYNRPLIQRLASGLTKDFNTARYLYNEVVHLAMKNKANLREDTFRDWLIQTMKETYSKISRNEYSLKN